jgi:hypothetical protein
MDNQTRTRTIKASVIKLGYDEAALNEILYFVKGKLRDLAMAKPREKKLMKAAVSSEVFSMLEGKFKG